MIKLIAILAVLVTTPYVRADIKPFMLPPGTRAFVVHAYVVTLPISNHDVRLMLRGGRTIVADASIALTHGETVTLYPMRAVAAVGYYDVRGTFHVISMNTTEDSERDWPPDGPVILNYRGYRAVGQNRNAL